MDFFLKNLTLCVFDIDEPLTFFLPEVQVIEVTDKPATTDAPPAEQAFVRNMSPVNPENETEIVEAQHQGQSRATSYPITYHGGPVMKTPGRTSELILPKLFHLRSLAS